jgi:hypothetical protein
VIEAFVARELYRGRTIRWKMLLALVAALLCGATATAETAAPSPAASSSPSPEYGPSVPPGMSPFCAIQYTLFNWDMKSDSEGVPTDRLLGALYANGRTVGATLHVFTDTESFEATIPQLRLWGSTDAKWTSEFIIELPESTHVKYAYVESYSLDRGKPVQCSAVPEALASFKTLGWKRPPQKVLSRLPAFAALSQGALPPLRCSDEFDDATVRHAEQPYGPPQLQGSITSRIAVFLAADGSVAKVAVAKSSGNGMADALAEGAAMKSVYAPAQFRCRAVSSQYIFTVDFEPDTNKIDP